MWKVVVNTLFLQTPLSVTLILYHTAHLKSYHFRVSKGPLFLIKNHELCLLATETIKQSSSSFRMAIWLHCGELIREGETRQGFAGQESSWVLTGLRSSQGPSHKCPLCATQPCWFWNPFLYPGATLTVIWRTFKSPLWGQWHSYQIDLDSKVVKHSNQVLSPSEFPLGLQSLRTIEVEMPGTKAHFCVW